MYFVLKVDTFVSLNRTNCATDNSYCESVFCCQSFKIIIITIIYVIITRVCECINEYHKSITRCTDLDFAQVN